MWHTVHANVTQADAIAGPLANADALASLNAGPHEAELKLALEGMTGAVEHMGAQGVCPSRGGGEHEGKM
jgi:hypothetical protein